jgi:aminotransferase in exopolysaccharide biosynthesis
VTDVISKPDLIAATVDAVRSVVGAGPVALHEPSFGGREWDYVKECLDSTFVSSVGKFVDRFENELADFTGAGHVVVVVNGTAALHVALRLAGVEPGDEVLVPALTFIATANAVSYCHAVPHFIESEEVTLGVDPDALRAYLRDATERKGGLCVNKATGRVIRAVVPMHTFGHPVRMDELIEVAREFDLVVVEDAAESLGSYYRGRHTGTLGMLGTLSFNGNKTITTGGGGAILTNDRALALRAKHITTTAKLPHAWDYTHDEVGYNYRMPNINAALGCAQLEQLPRLVEAKRDLYKRYEAAFSRIDGVKLKREPADCVSNYWLQALELSPRDEGKFEGLLDALNRAGFMSRPAWTLMHKLKPYRDCPRMELTQSESLAKRLVNIPSSSFLGQQSRS